MTPSDLSKRLGRPTLINSYVIEKIEIDLAHINYGLDTKKGYGRKARSTFVAEDIVKFFESLNGLEIEIEVDENWEYFIVDKPFFEKNKMHRMVFCIDRNVPIVAGVITVFQIKRRCRMSYPDQKRIFKVLDKIKSGKIMATQLIDESASPIDKMKFNICQAILLFKREHDFSNLELAEIMDVGPAVVSRILHCQITKFKVDSLLGYYFSLVVSSKDKKLIKKFNEEVSTFLKDLAA